MVPDKIQFGLHVTQVCRIDDNGILLWNDDDILTAGTVGTESIVPAAPYLIAVPLYPVAVLGRKSALSDFVGPYP